MFHISSKLLLLKAYIFKDEIDLFRRKDMLISKGKFSLCHLGAAVGSKKEDTAIHLPTLCPAWSACTHRMGWKVSCIGQQNIGTTCRVHHCVMILGSD